EHDRQNEKSSRTLNRKRVLRTDKSN
ncbi:hypothetical protein D043_0365B, partial [Vibrio parahaemolyticus EKP-021]